MGEKETMTSADARPKSGSLDVSPAGGPPGAHLASDGSPGAASRSVTYVEDPGVSGGLQPAEGKGIVRTSTPRWAGVGSASVEAPPRVRRLFQAIQFPTLTSRWSRTSDVCRPHATADDVELV